MAAQEKMTRARFGLALTFLLFAEAAAAQNSDLEAARALVSNYQLADASGERKCTIALDAKPSPPGFTLTLDRAVCTPLFGYLADVAAWKPAPAGGIYFVSAGGAIVAEFTEGVGGVYEALRERDGVYFLANLQFADPAAGPLAKDMLGEWKFARPNGPVLCRIALLETPIAEDRYGLKVTGSCDSAIASFGPVAWQLDRGDLVLFSAKDERLRFGRGEDGVWAKVPDRPHPLLMTRP